MKMDEKDLEKVAGGFFEDDYAVYTVEEGDTLSSIAENFCDGAHEYSELVRANELARINGIQDPNLIRVGQKIIVPFEGWGGGCHCRDDGSGGDE